MTRTIQEMLLSKLQHDTSVQYMDTTEAYNKWAEVYDTDGNFLQALDTIEMRTLLPQFLSRVTDNIEPGPGQPLKLIDLGCGTARNTLQLLRLAPLNAEIIGLDASPGMLKVARATIQNQTFIEQDRGGGQSRISLEICDLLQIPFTPPRASINAAGVISTLVVEHIPLDRFFEGAAALLRPGGYLLLTNMHSEMGLVSQAGFVDPAIGTKIRPTSYCHTVEDVLGEAGRAGFQIEELGGERVRERMVDDNMLEVLGKRAKKWVDITVWFGICFRKCI